MDDDFEVQTTANINIDPSQERITFIVPEVEKTPLLQSEREQEKAPEKIPLWKQLGRKKPGPAPGVYQARKKAKEEQEAREQQIKMQKLKEEMRKELQQEQEASVDNYGGVPSKTEATFPVQTVSISYEKIPLTQLKQMASIYNRAAHELVSPKWTNKEHQVGRDTIAFVCAMRDAYIEEVKQGQPSYDPTRTGSFD